MHIELVHKHVLSSISPYVVSVFICTCTCIRQTKRVSSFKVRGDYIIIVHIFYILPRWSLSHITIHQQDRTFDPLRLFVREINTFTDIWIFTQGIHFLFSNLRKFIFISLSGLNRFYWVFHCKYFVKDEIPL